MEELLMKDIRGVDTGKAQPLFHTFPVINIMREDNPVQELQLEKKAEENQILAGLSGILSDASETVIPTVKQRIERDGGNVIEIDVDPSCPDFEIAMDGDTGYLETVFDYGDIGLKPTAGLISRVGMKVKVPSLDRPVIMAKDVSTCAGVLEAAAGVDAQDPVSRDAYVYDFTQALDTNMEGMKIAVIENPYEMKLTEEQIEEFHAMLAVFADKGAQVEYGNLDWEEYIDDVHNIVYCCEKRMTTKEMPMDDTDIELKFGDYILLGNDGENYEKLYLKALKLRSLIKDSYNLLFREYALLAIPFVGDGESQELNTYALGANLAGIPMMAVPKEFYKEQPAQTFQGMYLIAGANCENNLIKAAYTYEQEVK